MTARHALAAALIAATLAGCAEPPIPTDAGRWTQPIRLYIDAGVPPDVASQTRGVLRSLAHEASVTILASPADAATVVVRVGPRCRTNMKIADDGRIASAEMVLKLNAPRGIGRCVNHEAMHVMGLLAHPTGTASVLSYDPASPVEVTAEDRRALRRLYRR